MLPYALLFISSSLAASYDEILDVGGLTDSAAKVVTAKVKSQTAFEKDGLIYTKVSLDVKKTWMGPRNRITHINVVGGTYGDLTLTVSGAPKFETGEDTLLFLDDNQIIGFGQGAFAIKDGRATRDLDNPMDEGPQDFDLKDTLPDEEVARDCLETKVWEDYDDGWSLRTLDASSAGEGEMQAYPITLMASNQYEFIACSDDKVHAIDLSLADNDGDVIAYEEVDGREALLPFEPEVTDTYYLTVAAIEIAENASRVGLSVGILYK
jgi:hypothetical protein